MTHQIFNLPPQQPLSAAGRVLPGAKLYFYLTTTTTPTPVYTTSARNVAHSQPLIADAGGRFSAVYLDPAIQYKATVTDANDVLLYTIDPVNDQLLSQAIIGEYLYPRTATEISVGVTPVNYAYPPGDVRRYGYVADGLDDDTDTGTDNTQALQNALDANAGAEVYLPHPDIEGRVALFTSVTIPPRTKLIGDGPRTSVLRQISHTATDAFTLEDIASTDISEGAFIFRDFGIKAAVAADGLSGANGINIGEVHASLIEMTNIRIWSQQQEVHVVTSPPPYPVISGQRGIYVHPNFVGAVFVAMLSNVEIRAFDIAIDASGGANEWAIYNCWFIDNRVANRIDDCSTWRFDGLTVESGVSEARCFQLVGETSNIRVTGGRWELTRPVDEPDPGDSCYGIEGDGSWTGHNIRIRDVNVLINGDGSSIPGLKWTGTMVDDMVFDGYTGTTGNLKPFSVIPNLVAMRLPNDVILGGSGLGNGRIRMYRNDGTVGGTLETGAGAQLDLTASNEVNVFTGGSQTASRFDDSTTAGNTRLLIYDVDNGQLERVSVGAADSGGTGFKVLRIPN